MPEADGAGSGGRLGAREWILVVGALVFAPLFFFKYLGSGEMANAVVALALFVVACLVLGWAGA